MFQLLRVLNETLKFIEEVIKHPTFINDELDILDVF